MFRVVVADDEPIAVESIVYMIKKNFTSIEIVGTSRSGRDAIEKAYTLHPDIMIMDINMPGIDGLEAMKQIRQVNQTVKFVIISAFDYFDYAVEAVNIKVVEYLLKPVKEVKLIEVLERIQNDLEKERANRKRELENQERLELVIPILENGFIHSLCMYDDTVKELKDYCKLFGYRRTSGYVLILELGVKQHHKIENKIGAGTQGERLYIEFKKILKNSCECIVGPIMLNRIVVYVFEQEGVEAFLQKSNAILLAQAISKRVQRFYPEVYIGIGRYYQNIEDAKKSYKGALEALRILSFSELEEEETINNILHVDDILDNMEQEENEYEKKFKQDIYLILNKSVRNLEATTIFEEFYATMAADSKMSLENMKNQMIGLIVWIAKQWGEASKDYCRIFNEIVIANDRQALYHICKPYILEMTSKILCLQKEKTSSIIDRANNYIEENYREDVALEDVAKAVNLSSYYFSRFYKEETGINFTDKLVNVRIERAKKLLLKEELSIKEVASMVGFSDPNYFSKIFKKMTGHTASNYKKECNY